jgi:CyaY protein
MDEQLFQTRASTSMDRLYEMLNRAAETRDFEADLEAGALKIEFEDPPARFVVSPNSPVRQIWVSANVKSFKLDWSDAAGDFVLASSGQTLPALMAEQISILLGEAVPL